MSGQDILTVTTGPEGKQEKKIDKNSKKINGLADEGHDYLKSSQKERKNSVLSQYKYML